MSQTQTQKKPTITTYVRCEECGDGVKVACAVKHVTAPYTLNICGDCLSMIGPLRTPTETSALNIAREWATRTPAPG